MKRLSPKTAQGEHRPDLWEADHLLGVEDGHQAVVAALSAWADGARNIGLALNRGVRWSPCLRRVPISGAHHLGLPCFLAVCRT